MSLKTDYKDAVLASGVGTLRKYQQIDNGDGTISLHDVSTYSQVGDKGQASVFNMIGAEVNAKSTKSTLTAATLPASGWTGSAAPYSQTISVASVTTTSANEILPGASITAEELEALQSANIQDGGQAAGSITLLAYGDLPAIDLPVQFIVRGDL